MTSTNPQGAAESKQRRRFSLLMIFIIFGLLAFSDSVVFLLVGSQNRWWVLPADFAILALIGVVLGFQIRRQTAGHSEVIGAFIAAFMLTLIGDLLTASFPSDTGLAIVADIILVTALSLLVVATAFAAPASGSTRDFKSLVPVIPVLVGVFAAYLTGTAWDSISAQDGYPGDVATTCGTIDQQYFVQVSQVIPALLIALGVERRFFASMLGDPISRATTVLTVTVLSIAELLALSALVRSNECGEALTRLHEYATFELTVAAAVIGLGTLVRSLFVERTDDVLTGTARM